MKGRTNFSSTALGRVSDLHSSLNAAIPSALFLNSSSFRPPSLPLFQVVCPAVATHIAFNPMMSEAAIACTDGSLVVWDPENGMMHDL
jgi:hypothetical protein